MKYPYKKDGFEWLNIRVANGHWFSKSTMRFFGSKIYWNTLTRFDDGWAFISSEGDDYNTLIPRGWTIRFVGPDWKIGNDLTPFRELPDFQSAKSKLAELIKEREDRNVSSNN